MSRSDRVRAAVAEITGDTPSSVHPLGGGDASAAFEVRLTGNRTVFAKTAGGDMPGALAAEAASLNWLGDAGGVPVPTVHGCTDDCLVTDHISTAAPSKPAAEELGRGLARLHAAGASAHGAPPPGGPADAWIGLAPMRNEPAPDWPSFYATHRIEPYLRSAVDSGTLTAQEGEVIAQVCTRLDDLAGPAEPPARLHGDLWNGNVHWGDDGTGTRAWLIDPAAHGGHRETDLAMLQLFGCPHVERILSAYDEVHPLAEGWRDRVGLHQLFPLLVHAVLFGRGFATRAVDVARSALG